MNVDPGVSVVVGRFEIRSATHPPVWPFLRAVVIEARASGAAGGALVRVFTAGGALLRSYAGRIQGGHLRVTGVEGHGQMYDLCLTTALDEASRHVLIGSFAPAAGMAAGPAVFEGGWIADVVVDVAASHAA